MSLDRRPAIRYRRTRAYILNQCGLASNMTDLLDQRRCNSEGHLVRCYDALLKISLPTMAIRITLAKCPIVASSTPGCKFAITVD